MKDEDMTTSNLKEAVQAACNVLYAVGAQQEASALIDAMAASEAQAEPVAWSVTFRGEHCGNVFNHENTARNVCARLAAEYPDAPREVVPLYEHPPAPLPLPEPDLLVDCAQGFVRGWTESALEGVLKLAAFGAWCAREFRRDLADVDGGSAQDEMARIGVLELHEALEPCGEGCVCAEYGDFPHECFRLAADVRPLVDGGPNA